MTMNEETLKEMKFLAKKWDYAFGRALQEVAQIGYDARAKENLRMALEDHGYRLEGEHNHSFAVNDNERIELFCRK